MIDARQFNLLPHVEKKRWLTAKISLFVILIYAMALFAVYLLARLDHAEIDRKISAAENNTTQAVAQLKQYLSTKGQLAAVLPSSVVLDSQGFYKEFNALSKIKISGLWLTRVIIDRDTHYVKITGDMTSTGKLNQLLDFLGKNTEFKQYHFKGIEVSEEFLPNIQKAARKKAEELKIPKIYRFTVQTTAIKSNSKRS